jgi:5,10-methylene-tetrahydrofolate dehydrogenase/methenyl tetrahydrofolate cyclohydrolase
VVCLSWDAGVTIEGKEAVVIGRSNIVGIPVSLLLMQARYTAIVVRALVVSFACVSRGDPLSFLFVVK